MSEELDLAVDVGNTRTKLALFSSRGVVRTGHAANGDMNELGRFLDGVQLTGVVIGAVGKENDAFLSHVGALAPLLVVTGETPVPLSSGYTTLATLGADRLANAVAASQRFAGRPVLAIDLGTCITYDLVDADGTYAGGAISPGMQMRAQAMHAHSARLPLVDPAPEPPALGNSTHGSMEAGIHHGIVGEINGLRAVYGHQRPQMVVVLTGGDALRFVRALKNGIFALPLLTLEGLYAILAHHRTLHRDPADADGFGGTRPGATG